MMGPAGKGPARLQRVPFLPDLLEGVLAAATAEELQGLLDQLEARRLEVLSEREVAKRLEEDIPGGGQMEQSLLGGVKWDLWIRGGWVSTNWAAPLC